MRSLEHRYRAAARGTRANARQQIGARHAVRGAPEGSTAGPLAVDCGCRIHAHPGGRPNRIIDDRQLGRGDVYDIAIWPLTLRPCAMPYDPGSSVPDD
jgi:hypothetical protein